MSEHPDGAALNLALSTLPTSAVCRSVTASSATREGRAGLRVSLTDEIVRDGVAGVDFVDQPTMVMLPAHFTTGTLTVDLCSVLTADAPDYARGFAGLEPPSSGVGLFVDIGTDALFANLRVVSD